MADTEQNPLKVQFCIPALGSIVQLAEDWTFTLCECRKIYLALIIKSCKEASKLLGKPVKTLEPRPAFAWNDRFNILVEIDDGKDEKENQENQKTSS